MKNRRTPVPFLAAFLSFTMSAGLHAGDVIKADNTVSLNTAGAPPTGSWVAGVVPTTTDVGVWDNTVTSANAVALGANLSWSGIRIADPAGLVTISAGNTLTLGTGGIVMSAATQDLVLNAAVALGGAQSWNVGTGRSITAGGILSGSGAFTKTGAGSLTFNGANTRNAATTISGGTLTVASTSYLYGGGYISSSSYITVNGGSTLKLAGWNYGALGSVGQIDSGSTSVLVDNGTIQYTGPANATGTNARRSFKVGAGGATLQAEGTGLWTVGEGNNTTNNPIPISSSGVLTLGGSQTGDFKSYVTGTGSVVKTDAGTWTFGSNYTTAESGTYNGNTTIQNGTLKLRSGFAANAIPSGSGKGNVIVNSPGILDLNTRTTTVNGLSGNGTVTSSAAGALTLTAGANDQTSSFGGVIQDGSGTMGLTKTGTGTLTLGGTNNYSGATTVTTGKLALTGSLAAGSAVAINGTSTLSYGTLGGTGTINGPLAVNQFGHLAPSLATGTTASTLNVSGNVTLAGGGNLDAVFTLNGAANDLVHGAGTNTLTLPVSGTTAVNLLNSAGGLGNGTYTLFDNFSSVGGGSPATALAVGSSPLTGKSYTFTATAGGVTLNIADQSIYIWNGSAGSNLQTGGNWVGGSAPTPGTGLHFAGSTSTSPNNDFPAGTSFGAIVFESGAAAFTIGGNAIGVTGDIANSSTNNQTVNTAIAFSGIRVADTGAAGITLGGDITGLGTLTKNGTGILLLGGNNTAYTGDVTIATGTLKAGSSNALPTTSLTLTDTLDVNGYNLTLGLLTGTGTVTSSATGSPVLTLGNASGSTFSGILQNGSATALGLTKQGSGTLTLSGANTYTGTTTINAGTLALSGGAALSDTAAVSLANVSGAALLLNASETIGTLDGGGTTGGGVNLQANTLSLAGAGSSTYTGVISGAGAVVKNGSGTLTLSGANTYSGNVTVSGGTLEVSSTGRLLAATTFNSTAVVSVTNGAVLKMAGWNYDANGSFGDLDSGYARVVLNNGIIRYSGAANAPGSNARRAFSVNSGGGTLQAEGSGLWTIGGTANSLYNQIPLTGNGVLTLGGSQNGSFGSYVTGTGSVVKTDAGTWTFGSLNAGENNTYNGATTVLNGTLVLRSGSTSIPIPSGTGVGNVTVTSPGVLDLNSRSTTLNGLSGTGTVTSGTGGALTLTVGANDQTSTFAGTIQNGAGLLSLTKVGTGTLRLTGGNSYTGTTTVSAGTLQLSTASLADAADVYVTSSSVLDLETGTTDTVHKFYIDGVAQVAGVWGSPTSGAPNTSDRIAGTGLLNVTADDNSTFTTWATSHGLSGDPTADFDHDGIPDGVEYVLGTDPTARSAGGPAMSLVGSNLVFTFNRDRASETLDTTVWVDVGTDLESWPMAYYIGTTTALSSFGVTVTSNVSSDTITVTVPRGIDTTKFARLRVSVSQ